VNLNIEQLVKKKLKNTLGEKFAPLSYSEDLYAWGFDSFKIVKLIVELEEVFNIAFDEEELLFENFATPGHIIAHVKRKLVLL
jgi:D-alanine--poly(phosphoribitol) ligase subunit 2